MSNNTVNPTLDAALDYGALGLKVIPLVPGEKRPTQEDWVNKATSDPKRNRQRFQNYDRNIGLLMGQAEDGRTLFCLDDDTAKKGRSFAKWLCKRKLPDTATSLTASGGSHRLFYAPKGVTITSHTGDAGIGPGIDIIGDKGQIVVEPSTFNGREYVWTRHPSQGIAEAPSWLIAIIRKKQGGLEAPTKPSPTTRPTKPLPMQRATVPGEEGALLQDALTRFQVLGQGQRNRKLYQLISSLICQGRTDATTLLVARNWWDYWFAFGTAGDPTDEKQILRQIACTRRALDSGKLIPSGDQNHKVGLSALALSQAQEEAVSSLIIIRTLTGLERREKLCAGKLDRAFVGACLLHFRYEREKGGESSGEGFKATNAQIRELMEDRFEVTVSDNNFRILKARFVSKDLTDGRGVIGARRFSLLRMVFQGSREAGGVGVPSRYAFEERFEELLALGDASNFAPAIYRYDLATLAGVSYAPPHSVLRSTPDGELGVSYAPPQQCPTLHPRGVLRSTRGVLRSIPGVSYAPNTPNILPKFQDQSPTNVPLNRPGRRARAKGPGELWLDRRKQPGTRPRATALPQF
jgi:hypothetical protein